MQTGKTKLLGILGGLLGTSAISQQAAPETATVQLPSESHRRSYLVGDQWCYRNFQVASGNENRTWIETITQVEDAEARIQQIDRVSGVDQIPTIKTWDLKKGLYKGTLSVGETWTEPVSDGIKIVGQSESKVLRKDWIDTPIGRLEAFEIENKFNIHAHKYRQIFWFSPEIGNVVILHYLDKR